MTTLTSMLIVVGTLAAPNDKPWPMDQVYLKDNTVRTGLITSDNKSGVELTEIHRPQGKPMYLVVRPILRDEIERIATLDAQARRQLAKRIQRFRSRAAIETGRMSRIQLTRDEDAGAWRYQGNWFQLDSTLDESMTRRCTVRLEQMFLAYRQVLPPRHLPRIDNRLRIKVFGSTDAYYEDLRRRGIDIRNPAYYDVDENLVVVGGDLGTYATRLAQAREEHQRLVAQCDTWAKNWSQRGRTLEAQLVAQGMPRDRRAKILAAARARWETEIEALRDRIKQTSRRNDKLLDQLATQMLKRLYHEAFHAYLEDYVYRSAAGRVPNWLNEGLAQIFETGLLDAGVLRVDAPDTARLRGLQADLQGPRPLRLADLLAADAASYLVHQQSGSATSNRYYLYAWGLTYYLAFEMALLDTPRLDEYVAQRADSTSPRKAFQRLVDMPLDGFETRWREAMLGMKSAASR